jgi:ADP-heptose:LPS heptosyltransferase
MTKPADQTAYALSPEIFYFAGNARIPGFRDALIPLAAFFGPWENVETWGCWTLAPFASLRVATALPAQTSVRVAVQLHVPPGSVGALCTLRAGSDEQIVTLDHNASWHILEGIISSCGELQIDFSAGGEYGRPDGRHLFVGLHEICFSQDTTGRLRRRLNARTNPEGRAIRGNYLSVLKHPKTYLLRALRNSDNAPHSARPEKTMLTDIPDAALALRFARVCLTTGRLRDAEAALRKAIDLDPSWSEPALLLSGLYRSGWRMADERYTAGNAALPSSRRKNDPADSEIALRNLPPDLAPDSVAIPEFEPVPLSDLLREHRDGAIEFRRFGMHERTPWGQQRRLRGVEAIRGVCLSSIPLTEMRMLINGQVFYRGSLKPFPLKLERTNTRLRKFVFNVWFDFSLFVTGKHEIEFQFVQDSGGMYGCREQVVIAAALPEELSPSSDGLVSTTQEDPLEIAREINAQPSMVRTARRRLFTAPIRTVLVQRTDQLGDLVCSVTALRRLRQLLPNAKFVGLLSTANSALGRTLDIFDEIVEIEFPDDPIQRRRLMCREKQDALRHRLAAYQFDIAIDLSEAGVSRPLLLLSGAKFLFGFEEPGASWMTGGFFGFTRDPVDKLEAVPHTHKALGLVEWLGVIMGEYTNIIKRTDFSRSVLTRFGLADDRTFAVLHSGARLEFSRWPHYLALAVMLIEHTHLSVVMMTDDPTTRSKIPDQLASSDRFQLLDEKLAFDEFDALVSFCSIFVGNDSGPKHLASLRGANIVSLHMARNNWNEWGQENRGLIMSRKVPCAGCVIHHEPEECGADFACISKIKPEEVFEAVQYALKNPD